MRLKFSILPLLIACLMAGSGAAFAKNDKAGHNKLPPGLQKKVSRGQPLPPGWQKKLAPGKVMDREVYRQSRIVVPVDSKGLLTVSIEGKLVRVYENTREIIEILD